MYDNAIEFHTRLHHSNIVVTWVIVVCNVQSGLEIMKQLKLHIPMHKPTEACKEMHTHTHARMHARTHARTHTRTHARTHTLARTHTCAHTHTHTHTQTCIFSYLACSNNLAANWLGLMGTGRKPAADEAQVH